LIYDRDKALDLPGAPHPAAEIESAAIYRSNEFASWAPEEETAAAERVLLKMKSLPIGGCIVWSELQARELGRSQISRSR
jgi:hypothetical protein